LNKGDDDFIHPKRRL